MKYYNDYTQQLDSETQNNNYASVILPAIKDVASGTLNME